MVTVARSDYGIYLPVLRGIQEDPSLELKLIVGGMHLSPEFGLTVQEIDNDGFEICERVEMLVSSDTPSGIAKSIGLGTMGFSQAYERLQPDILLVLGDRFEMLSAVLASLPFGIPVAHIGGGESTEGLIDEPIRHSITKMSHIHFAATKHYAQRITQMGEDPSRVVVSGAPGLDNLSRMTLLNRQEFQERHGIGLDKSTLLVTYHPVTLQSKQTETHTKLLLQALDESGLNVIFTYPNADTHGRLIISMIHQFTDSHPNAQVAINLGTQGYFSLMSHAMAMVGNSSSGIIEAASFELPVVNIGERQRGRDSADNVIHVGNTAAEITNGIKTAISVDFRSKLAGLVNPYGDSHASERIVQRLREVELGEDLLLKRFYEAPSETTCA